MLLALLGGRLLILEKKKKSFFFFFSCVYFFGCLHWWLIEIPNPNGSINRLSQPRSAGAVSSIVTCPLPLEL